MVVEKEMSTAVKPLMVLVASAFLLIFAGFCFSQSESLIQQAWLKGSAAPTDSTMRAQQKPKVDEKIPPAAPDAIFPAVVARVNGEPILGRDLEALVRGELSSIGNPEWKDLRGQYRGELTLNKITVLINSKLIYQKAAASGVRATEAEVQSELQRYAKTFKSEAEMNAALASQNMDRAALEESLYETVVVAKYVDETVAKKIAVTPAELQKYYSRYPDEFHHPDVVRTSHILIRAEGNNPKQDSTAKRRAEGILARINKGENFEVLAREHSMDSSASKGGDRGFASKNALAPEYAAAAFSMPVGGMKLVKTQDGYHIVKVTDKKGEGSWTLEEVKAKLTEYLAKQKYQAELNKLVEQLREKADIEILISARELLNP
jgi:peptidyl-prolyl cis-trans isomerase C